MIPTKTRKLKAIKLPKILERQYKQAKCQDCKVVVTRMDFAKILGKFTKVKIQFESNSPKTKLTVEPSPNTRLKNNENGMVQVHRSSYNLHPARKLLGSTGKKTKNVDTSPRQATRSNETASRQTKKFETLSPRQTTKSYSASPPQRITKSNGAPSPRQTTKRNESILPRLTSKRKETTLLQQVIKKNETLARQPAVNILKENNQVKKPVLKNLAYDSKILENTKMKHYGIVFDNPSSKNKDPRSKINLDNLLPNINSSVLPSDDWSIEYFPLCGEPKEDKIYDRIAAELEDLMYNEKTKINSSNKDGKNDEFPSILDILNDNPKGVTDTANDQSSSVHLESSDVEAMLLGKSKSSESLPMDTDNPGGQINSTGTEKVLAESTIDDNPNSPSILDEPELKEVPVLSVAEKPLTNMPKNDFVPTTSRSIDENDNTHTKNKNNTKSEVTQVIFKKKILGSDTKTVICPKNLKYNILIQGKSVELLGAPKALSCIEDLQVLLQIVDESELTSLYVLH